MSRLAPAACARGAWDRYQLLRGGTRSWGTRANGAPLHRHYQHPEFAAALLELLRDDLRIPGWANLPIDLPSALIHIHKVSGSLTNAVFFVSIPPETLEVSTAGSRTPVLRRNELSLSTVSDELERRSTPTPEQQSSRPSETETHSVLIEAPTLLLRIYGPSSGSLISRKTELHILHTLSSAYAIGPRVLGTFSNGRVEEYFHSRALHKEEMRDPTISRWIGRRMRELHRVPLEMMEVPGGADESGSWREGSGRSSRDERPSPDAGGRPNSGGSVYSTSSSSSVFSFGASSYSTSSGGSASSTFGSEFGTPLTSSPMLLPRRGSSESRADSKKRSRSKMSSRSRRARDKLGVWENITRWTREAKLVLKELDQLAALQGFSEFLGPSPSSESHHGEHVAPLSYPSLTFQLRAALNLPLFEQQVKLYRTFVRDWEKQGGKSKRVFSHNDTQYGNLLLLTPPEDGDERALERSLQAPHQKIIVVDFEYASANPRGFDIGALRFLFTPLPRCADPFVPANHFIEWQADYHHPTLSHSLLSHDPYPTLSERSRFLRAYVGCDGGADTGRSSSDAKEEDPRVVRLEEEVQVWEPSSHAMWAVWGIVQAKEDLLYKVAKWKKACEKRQEALETGVAGLKLGGGESGARPVLMRGKSGETVTPEGEAEVDDEEGDPAADFDYLSYTLGRMTLFRQGLKELGVVE